MIYFIRPESDEPIVLHRENTLIGRPIKIGSSISPKNRLEYLRYYHRRPDLAIAGVMSGGILAERRLHEKFAHLRNSYAFSNENCQRGVNRTEWFRAEDDLLGFIAKNAVPFDPEIVVASHIEIDERFLMWAEQIAFRKKVSVQELLWTAVREYIADESNIAYPFTKSGDPWRF